MHLILNFTIFSKESFSHKAFIYNMRLKMYTIYICNVSQYSEYFKGLRYMIKLNFTF